MQRAFVITVNTSILVLLLVGLPAATRDQVGNLQLSSASATHLVMEWGLASAAMANILASWLLFKVPKKKTICWEWAAIFGALWLVYFFFLRGDIRFGWLRQSLLWIRAHL